MSAAYDHKMSFYPNILKYTPINIFNTIFTITNDITCKYLKCNTTVHIFVHLKAFKTVLYFYATHILTKITLKTIFKIHNYMIWLLFWNDLLLCRYSLFLYCSCHSIKFNTTKSYSNYMFHFSSLGVIYICYVFKNTDTVSCSMIIHYSIKSFLLTK